MPIITPRVDPGFAAWLKEPARYVVATDSDIVTRWGDAAKETTLISSIALEADAVAEAERELRFLGGPLARDDHVVKGLRHDLIGKRVRLRSSSLQPLGYDGAGALAIVVKAVESETSDTTTLTVIRRLA